MNVITVNIGRGPIFSNRKSKKSLSLPLSRLAVRDAQTKVRVNLTPQVSCAWVIPTLTASCPIAFKGAQPAKSKMFIRGPQNCRRGLERHLISRFMVPRSTLAPKTNLECRLF